MKKLSHVLVYMAIMLVSTGVAAALTPEEQVLADNEKAGIYYVVPEEYSNMGAFDGSHPYTVLGSEDDFSDSFSHQIRVYTVPTNVFTTLLKNAKTSAEAKEMFVKNYPFKPNEALVSVEIRTVGKERFTIMDMTRTDGVKNLRYRVAHLEKNGKVYVVEFVDNAESFLTHNQVFETFLKNFYVKDLSKKIPFTGKSVSFQGAMSTMSFSLPEGYYVMDDSLNVMYLRNARNQTIRLFAGDAKVSPFADLFKAKTDAELLNAFKNVGEFTNVRTDVGGGNANIKNAYIKTMNGQKMYVVDYEQTFVDMPEYMNGLEKSVFMLKNNTVYRIDFGELDSFADKHVDALLRTVKFKDSRRMLLK